MESRIVELKERSRRQIRRAAQVGVIALGTAVVLIGAFAVYRLTRPPTTRERLRRLLPARRRARLGLRQRVPQVRLYFDDRPPGEERRKARWKDVLVPAARAAGTAAAAALAPRLIAALTGSRRGRRGQETPQT
jgi:hypothetical protein